MKKIVNEYYVYDFNELNDNAKEKALNDNRDINTDGYDWWQYVLEDFCDENEEKGINIDTKNIYFSLNYSQGDYLKIDKGYIDAIKYIKHFKYDKYMPLIDFYEKNDLNLTFFINGNGNRHKSYIEFNGDDLNDFNDDLSDEQKKDLDYLFEGIELEIQDYIHQIEKDLFKKIEKYYEYLTSDDAIIETFLANEYTFRDNGVMDNS